MRVALRGYDQAEVDAFLDRCVTTLGIRASEVPALRGRLMTDRLVAGSVTPDDVATSQFRTGWRGYSTDEVDRLLVEVETVLRTL